MHNHIIININNLDIVTRRKYINKDDLETNNFGMQNFNNLN